MSHDTDCVTFTVRCPVDDEHVTVAGSELSFVVNELTGVASYAFLCPCHDAVGVKLIEPDGLAYYVLTLAGLQPSRCSPVVDVPTSTYPLFSFSDLLDWHNELETWPTYAP